MSEPRANDITERLAAIQLLKLDIMEVEKQRDLLSPRAKRIVNILTAAERKARSG